MTDDTTPDQLSSRPEYMLTTVDNPYDPFAQWDEWFAWDLNAGYNTPGFLARVARLGEDLPEGEQQLAIDQAIDEIVEENVLGVFKKIREGEFKTLSS
jgi:hypothetical protein